jgi:hypothetical protein
MGLLSKAGVVTGSVKGKGPVLLIAPEKNLEAAYLSALVSRVGRLNTADGSFCVELPPDADVELIRDRLSRSLACPVTLI